MGDTVGPDSATLEVVATAYDADGTTIISSSVPLTVEKIKIGEDLPDEDEADASDGLPETGTGPDLGDLLDSMEGAAAAAAASAESAREDCADAADAAKRTRERAESMAGRVDGLEGNLDDLEARRAEAADLRTEAAAALARANDLAQDVAELRDRAARLRDRACADADSAESASTQEERDRLVAEVRAAAAEIDRIETEAADLLVALRWEVETIQRRVETFESLVANLDRMNDRLKSTAETARELTDQLEEARSRVEEARAGITEVENRRAQGAAILTEADRRAADAPETAETLEAIGALNDLQATMETTEENVAPCADEATVSDIDPAAEAADEIQTRLDDLISRLQTARQTLTESGLGEGLEAMAAEASSLLEFTEVFLDTIRNRAQDAHDCADRAERSSVASDAVTMPNLVGQSETLAVAWLEDLGLHPIPQDAGPAPSLDKKEKVAAQSHPPNTSLPAGATVLLFVYAAPAPPPEPDPLPAPSFTQAVCDHRWPGTVLTRDPATGADNCQCPSGTAWSVVKNTCLSLGGLPPPRMANCNHMPGTIRNPATGACSCPVGAWDPNLGRCVDTAAPGREREIEDRRKAATCEKLFSDMLVFRRNPSSIYQQMADNAEREARAMGCDAGRIAEASGTGGGGADAPPTPVTGPVETEDEGEAHVSSRHVKICIVDVNDILDDHYDLFVNGAYIGSVANPEGGTTCHGASLRSGPNSLALNLVATRGKSTFLAISINNGEFEASFGGSNNHVWSLIAP